MCTTLCYHKEDDLMLAGYMWWFFFVPICMDSWGSECPMYEALSAVSSAEHSSYGLCLSTFSHCSPVWFDSSLSGHFLCDFWNSCHRKAHPTPKGCNYQLEGFFFT
jgi:hypothetical protein